MDKKTILEKNKQSPPSDEFGKLMGDRSYLIASFTCSCALLCILVYNILKGLEWRALGSLSFLFLSVQILYVFFRKKQQPLFLVLGILCFAAFVVLLIGYFIRTW